MINLNANVQIQKDWKGFEFGVLDENANPDLHNLAFPGDDSGEGWGALVTPDEIRYIHLAGLELVTQSGGIITDEMIRGLVNQYTRSVAAELQFEIYPRSFVSRDPDPRAVKRKEKGQEWYDLHDYRQEDFKKFWLVELRHRPLIRVTRWDLMNPWETGEPVLDLLGGADIHYNLGILRNTRSTARFGATGGTAPLRSFRHWGQDWDYHRIPNSYAVDFIAGHENARDVPDDLRIIITKVVLLHLLSAYGDALVAGIANFHISLSSISESVGTTNSATSSAYGARIHQLTGEVKEWYNANASRYRIPRMSVL